MQLWRTPLDADSVTVVRGLVHVIEHRCKGCSVCVEFCPVDTLVMGGEFNAKGYRFPVVAAGRECVNCKLCELLCPEFAIFSVADNGARRSGAPSHGSV